MKNEQSDKFYTPVFIFYKELHDSYLGVYLTLDFV